ncbi:Proteasome subunit [uncultured archaeon]|nr:Proteasome subunit [uncultured archaeon]
MTLIIGMYYDNKKGALIASDSKEVTGLTYGLTKKITLLDNIIFSIAGFEIIEEGFFDKFKQLKGKTCKSKNSMKIKEILRESIKKLGEESESNPLNKKRFGLLNGIAGFYNQTNPEIYSFSSEGVEPLETFRSVGPGENLVDYLFKRIYHSGMSQKQAIDIAIYSIFEVSKMYIGVDDNPQIALIDKTGTRILNYDKTGMPDFQNKEILEIKRKIKTISEKSGKYLDNLLLNLR